MKKQLRFAVSCGALLTAIIANGQTLNWRNFRKGQKHVLSISANADYAITFGTAYSYRLPSKQPTVLNIEYSFPSGNNLVDDYKIKTGAQLLWLQSQQFYFASKLEGIFRRYNNSYVRLLNFGADLSSTAGYYKKHWFVAAEIGFDKAIITHFKHSDLYKENYPRVKDGWYEPSTGGNFYYGILTDYSFKQKDIFLKFGKLIEQDFKTSPMLQVYAQLGLNIKLGKAAKEKQ